MNEFFDFLVAQLSMNWAVAVGMFASLLAVIGFAVYARYRSGSASAREALYLLFGMIALSTVLMTVAAALDGAEFDKLTSKAFNEQISNNAYNFQGTASCQKEGLQLNGTYKTEMNVKELALTVNVPVSVHVQNSKVCNLEYYPNKRRIELALQEAANKYISENSASLAPAILDVTKPKTVEVKAVPQFKGFTVEMPVDTSKVTVPVQNVGQGQNIKPKQPININTNISGQ